MLLSRLVRLLGIGGVVTTTSVLRVLIVVVTVGRPLVALSPRSATLLGASWLLLLLSRARTSAVVVH